MRNFIKNTLFLSLNRSPILPGGLFCFTVKFNKVFIKQKICPPPILFRLENRQIFFSLLRHNILQPDSFLDKDKSNHALDQVNRHNHKVDCVDRKSGKNGSGRKPPAH